MVPERVIVTATGSGAGMVCPLRVVDRIVYVPFHPDSFTPAITTESPARKLVSAAVVAVAVVLERVRLVSVTVYFPG